MSETQIVQEELDRIVELKYGSKNKKITSIAQRVAIALEEYYDRYRRHGYGYTERVKKVINGTSKRKHGFNQAEVAMLFLFDKEAHSNTGYFYTRADGILWHYNTIEAIKTVKGQIIHNDDCFSKGWAYCTKPILCDYSLNITMLANAIGAGRYPNTITQIEVIDQKEIKNNTYYERPAKLIRYKNNNLEWEYALNAYDDNGAFVALLKDKCKTVEDALESMKPKLVKIAEKNLNLEVKRQGDLFFIPNGKTAMNVQKRERHYCKRIKWQCSKCGKVGKSSLLHSYNCQDQHGYPANMVSQELIEHLRPYYGIHERFDECEGESEDLIPIIYDSWFYDPFPTIGRTDHSATMIGRIEEKIYNGTMQLTVVKGVIRHDEHRNLNLGTDRWHIVARNNIRPSRNLDMD